VLITSKLMYELGWNFYILVGYILIVPGHIPADNWSKMNA